MDILEQKDSVEEYLCVKANIQRKPISGCLELLPICNMNCDMCYVRLSHKEVEEQGGLLSVDSWIKLAKEMKKAGVLFVLITGGEPFLYPEFKKLYKELLGLGMIVTINTNGTLITEEIAEFLSKNKPRRVNITLYGSNNDTYEKLCHFKDGFDKTIRGIELLKKHNIDVKLNGSLVKVNKEEWSEMLSIAEQLGVPIKIDTYMYPSTRERNIPFNMQARLSPREAADIWLEIYKKQRGDELFNAYARENYELLNQEQEDEVQPLCMKCRAGRSSFIINWKGLMHPCIMMNHPAVSVMEKGFDKAWEEVVEKVENITLCMECAACKKREICSVCAASTYLENGTFEEKPKYICEFIDEILVQQNILERL